MKNSSTEHSTLSHKVGMQVMNNLVRRDMSPEMQREINKKIMGECMSIAGEDQSKTL